MPKRILIVSSASDKSCAPASLLKELSSRGYIFYFLGNKFSYLGKEFSAQKWPAKSCFLLAGTETKIRLLIALILSPISLLLYLSILANYKFAKKIDTIICLGVNEKLFFSLPAAILNLRIIWLEDPKLAIRNYKKLGFLRLSLYKLISRFANIIVFNNFTKQQLKKIGIKDEKIKIMQPAIKLNQREHQDNIFSGLAQADAKFKRNFFTIGTIIDLDGQQKVEALFGAVKICLSVMPNLQLIVVGEGEERKNLTWLAKKMGIDNVCWFVGDQSHLRKWLDSFDIYVVSAEAPGMFDMENTIKAMEARLPVIGSSDLGLEDIVYENKTGSLIEADNSEMLARQIMKLYKERRLRLKIGEIAEERAKTYFSIEKQVEEFEKILGT